MDPTQYFQWTVNPVAFEILGRGIRWYGILFALGIWIAFEIFVWQMLRAKHPEGPVRNFFLWGTIATLVGSRMGQVLFYEPDYYFAHPLEIFAIHKGGLASHGATLGLVFAMFLYARKYKFNFLEILDRFSMCACMGAIFVRLGNFMNSEIVGREFWGPWAIRFPYFDAILKDEWESVHGQLPFAVQSLPRHPSQLYEALGGLIVFLALFFVDKKFKEKRPRGLLAGMFFLLYFSFRFCVEFVKEHQNFLNYSVDENLHAIRVASSSYFTMGQFLSVPFIVLGIWLIRKSLKLKLSASVPAGKA